jgi:hypothetical protein
VADVRGLLLTVLCSACAAQTAPRVRTRSHARVTESRVASKLRSSMVESIHGMSGCPAESIHAIETTQGRLRVLACDEQFFCTLEAPSVCTVELE